MEVHVYWTLTNLSSVDEHDSHLYAFGRYNRANYIGQAYRQSVAPEIRQNLREFEESPHGLQIWIGQIQDGGTIQRVSTVLISSIESALIHTHQPSYNTHHKAKYLGRSPLLVRCKGLHPFKALLRY